MNVRQSRRPRLLPYLLSIVILIVLLLPPRHVPSFSSIQVESPNVPAPPPSPIPFNAPALPPLKVSASCADVIGIDSDEHRAMAERSFNYPPNTCEQFIFTRNTPAKNWRRGTWAKVDVIRQYQKELERFDFILVRDIDTKVNIAGVVDLLPKDEKERFIIGYTQKAFNSGCDEVEAVTNWFGFWNDVSGRGLMREWRRIKRNQTDQWGLNERMRVCCRSDVKCVDKCLSGIHEIHCRRKQGSQKRHYGNQEECIVSTKERNPTYYDTTANYECHGEQGKVGD